MSCSKLLSNSQKVMLYALRGIIHGVVLENMEKNIFKHLKITLPTNLLQFQNSGHIAPLDEIIKLKEKYRFRVILGESNSIGVMEILVEVSLSITKFQLTR